MTRLFAFLLTSVLIVLAPVATAQPETQTDWQETVPAEAARADLAALYDGLRSGHYDLYANRNRAEYDALHACFMDRLDAPLSRFELFQLLQEFTAFGKVAHARIDFPGAVFQHYREAGGRTFPIYPRIVEARVYVGEDYSGSDGVSPGDEILAIDGVPAAEWLARTARLISADTDYIAHSILEFAFPLYLWVETGPREAFDLRLRDRQGRVSDITIEARTRAQILEAAEAAPPVFSLDTNAREARMLGDTIAYLRPGPFYNVEPPDDIWNPAAFTAFIDAAFADFIESSAAALIIDLRDNPGGDNSFSDPVIAWIADEPFRFASTFKVRSSDEAAASNRARLDASAEAAKGVSGRYAQAYAETPRGQTFDFHIPFTEPREGERFEGAVYVLVNRHSYSNAVNTASIFKDYGWGVIAGEMTADFATTYGAMEHFTLPETGMTVGFPKALIIRPSGDPRPGGVRPDIAIETPIVPGTEDVVLERLVAIIEG